MQFSLIAALSTDIWWHQEASRGPRRRSETQGERLSVNNGFSTRHKASGRQTRAVLSFIRCGNKTKKKKERVKVCHPQRASSAPVCVLSKKRGVVKIKRKEPWNADTFKQMWRSKWCEKGRKKCSAQQFWWVISGVPDRVRQLEYVRNGKSTSILYFSKSGNTLLFT